MKMTEIEKEKQEFVTELATEYAEYLNSPKPLLLPRDVKKILCKENYIDTYVSVNPEFSIGLYRDEKFDYAFVDMKKSSDVILVAYKNGTLETAKDLLKTTRIQDMNDWLQGQEFMFFVPIGFYEECLLKQDQLKDECYNDRFAYTTRELNEILTQDNFVDSQLKGDYEVLLFRCCAYDIIFTVKMSGSGGSIDTVRINDFPIHTIKHARNYVQNPQKYFKKQVSETNVPFILYTMALLQNHLDMC